jgi:hypothetical protein
MRGELVILPTIAVGLAGAAVAAFAHQGSAQIAAQQSVESVLNRHQLEAMLLDTTEPIPKGTGPQATTATCKPGTRGPKLNPWACTVAYGPKQRIKYRIEVASSGSFTGADRTGSRTVRGCCLLGVAQTPAKRA